MSRWRWILVILLLVALGLWATLFTLNLRPELMQEPSRFALQFSNPEGLRQPLSQLPGWAASVGLFITLFLAGWANFYIFPGRIRNMREALSLGWPRVVQMALLGFGFVLLVLVFAVGAVLARITFPLAILLTLAFFLFAVWGLLSVAYALGSDLLTRADWPGTSPVVSLGLGLLLLLPLTRIPFVGGLVLVVYLSLGIGLVITTRFGSDEPWNLKPLLEEDIE